MGKEKGFNLEGNSGILMYNLINKKNILQKVVMV